MQKECKTPVIVLILRGFSLYNQRQTGGPSNVDEIVEGSPSRVAATSILPPRPSNTVFSRRRPLDQVLLSTYVPPHERFHPLVGMVAPNLEGA